MGFRVLGARGLGCGRTGCMSRLRNVAQVWGWLGQFPVVAAAEHSTVKLYPHEALLGWVPPMLSGTVYFKFVLHHLLPYLSKRSTA